MAKIPTPYDGMTIEQINMLIDNTTAEITRGYMSNSGKVYDSPTTYANIYLMAFNDIRQVVEAKFGHLKANVESIERENKALAVEQESAARFRNLSEAERNNVLAAQAKAEDVFGSHRTM